MAAKLTRILIANRGEIACRIIRTARAMGYPTVAVFSDADADALHAREADEAVRIGPPPAAQSYLDIARIVAAARATGADAVHPGYGFLSENAAFAEACGRAGLVFIGPSVEAIRLMGDKARAKVRMLEAGVPCVPGYHGADQDDAHFAAQADRIGYPIMVKAAAGGGGRGMRLVEAPDDLPAALKAARSEAHNAFGDPTLLLERAVLAARHVEIQVFGDQHGNVIHLGERDCSVQRRHQKVIEEAPSPAVDPALRAAMGGAAVAAARAIGYVGAGTVEFLLEDRNFFFLEMNTRLQVEHPVTELVTGLDLVALQLDVAAGKPLPLTQAQVVITGHAIESRVYAEDPRQGFLPQTGAVLAWEPTRRAGVRTDHGLREGGRVEAFYDPLLAKVIAFGADREEARRRLVGGLIDTLLLGVTTNKAFLVEALGRPAFVEGRATTRFIEENFVAGAIAELPEDALAAAAVLFAGGTGEGFRSSQWGETVLRLVVDGTFVGVTARRVGDAWEVLAAGAKLRLQVLDRTNGALRYERDGRVRAARFVRRHDTLFLDVAGRAIVFEDVTYLPAEEQAPGGDGTVRAPMSGRVIAVEVKPDDRVRRGAVVAVIEAMKMEHAVLAGLDGRVDNVPAVQGAQVAAREVLATIVADTGR